MRPIEARNILRSLRFRILGQYQPYLALLSKTDQKKLRNVALVQCVLGVLDLVGLLLIGALGALAVSGITTGNPGNKLSSLVQFFRISNLSFQQQTATLALLASTFLVLRTLLSIFTTRKILHFLGHQSAKLSSSLVSKFFSQSILRVNSKSIPETVYAATDGVNSIMIGIIGAGVNLLADFSLLLILGVGLFAINPIIAISTIIFFVLVGTVLHFSMRERARNFGLQLAHFSIANSKLMYEILGSYREAIVKNRRAFYVESIRNNRNSSSYFAAEMAFLPNISKYVVEISMVIGTILISASQFLIQDATHAISTLAIFLSAGTRIAPAILRIQQSATSIKANAGIAGPTLLLIKELHEASEISGKVAPFTSAHTGFEGTLEIESLKFTYPEKEFAAIESLSLSISQGEMLAIVGPSGSGKTTAIDLILGVLQPDSGQVLVSGHPPIETTAKWPGAMAYVAQDTALVEGTIKSNLCLGFNEEEIPDEEIWKALEIAQLAEVIEGLTDGLQHLIGERGMKLSGGQRQRLGIARALITSPKFIVLDEATSSLDAETELRIGSAIKTLRGSTTLVVVAHRLSTVRDADKILYLDGGKTILSDSFDQLRALVPDFDRQAKLMGL